MSRDIKFRGKRVGNGEWVYGSLVKSPNDSLNKAYISIDCEASYDERVGYFNNGSMRVLSEHFPVIPETVVQFTGLRDKNGKEIYEGDVLRYYSDARIFLPTEGGGWELKGNPHLEERAVVEWSNCLSAYMAHEGTLYLYAINRKSEIIGNIYENAELMEDW